MNINAEKHDIPTKYNLHIRHMLRESFVMAAIGGSEKSKTKRPTLRQNAVVHKRLALL